MTKVRLLGTIGALAVSAVLLAGCSGVQFVMPHKASEAPPSSQTTMPIGAPASGATGTGHVVITILDSGFSPLTAHVKKGDIVIWDNEGKSNHNVTPDGGGPSSGTIKPGGTANHMFPGAGTFAYHDSLHPDLKGKVIVK